MGERITGYVGDLTERFWAEGAPELARVTSLPALLPIGYGDLIRYENGVLTELLQRSNKITVALMVEPLGNVDYLEEGVVIQEVIDRTCAELDSRGAICAPGAGALVICGDLNQEVAAELARTSCAMVGLDPARVKTFTINRPTDPLDIDIRPAGDGNQPNPIPIHVVGVFLARLELWDRFSALVINGEIPSASSFHNILHASLNEAANDPMLRDAWFSGNLDAVLVAGARLTNEGSFTFPFYPEGLYAHFTYRAPRWPTF